MKILSGYPFYGQYIGVLVFSTMTPRIPGDAGHAETFSYPVKFEVVKGGFSDLIKGSPEIKQSILQGCQNLKNSGIRGIIGDCGMMSLYQDCIGAEIGLPFIGSSLCLLPSVWQMIGRRGTIGILTGHSEMLGKRHLYASGATDDIKLCIQGLQDEPHFHEIVIQGGSDLNIAQMNLDVLNAAKKLKQRAPDLRAVIIECSNLATYARYISDELEVPVFDIISAANLLSYGVHPPMYTEDFYQDGGTGAVWKQAVLNRGTNAI